MKQVSTRERMREEYARLVKDFAKQAKGLDVSGIPAPHIPIVGDNYDACSYKMAFVGMETYGWWSLANFLAEAESSPKEAVTKYESWFESAEPVKHNGNATFWGFIFLFLAKFYHIDKQKLLKQNEDGSRNDILSSIVWGNSNAVERFGVTAKQNGADPEVWRKVKDASKSFDNIEHIIKAAAPKVVFVLYKNVDTKYILQDSDISKEIPNAKRYAYRLTPDTELNYRYYYLREQDTHVFVLPHPRWIGSYSGIGFDKYIESLLQTMEELKIWRKLPEKEEDWKKPQVNRSSQEYKRRFIADLAHFLVSRDMVMTGQELQILFKNNGIKTSYGSNYSQKGGRGIHRVILSAWGYYYKKGDYQTALDIARAFVGKDLEYTYR